MDEVNNETKATEGKMDNVVHFEVDDVKCLSAGTFGYDDAKSDNVDAFDGDITIVDISSNIAKVDEMFPFLGEYEFNREVAMLSSDLQTSASAMLSAGCRILRLKEHEPHGKFMKAVEDVGLGYKTAKRFMSCALRFIEADTGKVKYPQLIQQTTSKIYELAMLDNDDLKALDEGGSVSNITLDDVDKLTTRELRKKLREAKAEKEALEAVINSKNTKLNEMEKELNMPKANIEYPDVTELNNKIDTLTTDSFTLSERIISIADSFQDLTTGNNTADAAYRMAYGKLKGIVKSIVEEMGRALDYVVSRTPECMTVNAGFTFTLDEGEEDL